jgi:hypothetical protein
MESRHRVEQHQRAHVMLRVVNKSGDWIHVDCARVEPVVDDVVGEAAMLQKANRRRSGSSSISFLQFRPEPCGWSLAGRHFVPLADT